MMVIDVLTVIVSTSYFFVFVNKLPRSDLFCLMSSDVLYVVVDVGSS